MFTKHCFRCFLAIMVFGRLTALVGADVECNSTDLALAPHRNCTDGQICCGLYNNECCPPTFLDNQLIGIISTNHTNEHILNNQTDVNFTNHTSPQNATTKKPFGHGFHRCISLNISLARDRTCGRGQYCCGQYNSTCCNHPVPKIISDEMKIIVILGFIGLVALFVKICDSKEDSESSSSRTSAETQPMNNL